MFHARRGAGSAGGARPMGGELSALSPEPLLSRNLPQIDAYLSHPLTSRVPQRDVDYLMIEPQFIDGCRFFERRDSRGLEKVDRDEYVFFTFDVSRPRLTFSRSDQVS